MKKLIVMLGVVASAAALQAATLQWGAPVAGPNYEDYVAGQQAYLLYSASSAALASEIVMAGSDISGWTVDNGMSVVDSYTLNDADVDPNVASFTDVFKRADADGGVNGYYQVALFSADGKNFAVMELGSISGIADNTGTGDLHLDWMNSTNWLGENGMTGTVTAQNVPEPTTVALLALGLAAVGLKRKVA